MKTDTTVELKDSTLQALERANKIDVQREGETRDWTFNQMVLKGGVWVLIVDFLDQIDTLDMDYEISIVLNPTNYNGNLRRNIEKYKNPQQDMLAVAEDYLNQSDKIHADYRSEAKQFGIFDFKAYVMKFERKTKSRQVKFLIDNFVAEHFNKNYQELHRSALVLNKRIPLQNK